ncbi:efflux RND transporter periplasmic adaptor subunit [Sphingobacterium puteale]|uniref:Efflux RND transporter periplasmic adaptor subunit n=1 Tax=Sphingobacterium puteale TaxID=2420510 RepID=A0A420VTZ0_9SPHI|nr:efflux RND transporter periplasmic adaptor subunit [Sphingobacterium puteale]RKO69727.1 efflux RND transporter periplasmic adaptor subunit [Sphingobacterium puteale]
MLYKLTKSRTGMFVPLLGIILIACESKAEKTAAVSTGTKTDVTRLPVDILIAQEEELRQDETVIGTMIPYREVSIVSELPQKIVRVAFQDGSYVEQGSILYILNDTDIRARLNQVGAELELAKLNKERLQNLLKTETIKQQEYDEALMHFRSLTARQELLRVELAKTIIRAPFSGKIGISKVHAGAYVIPGTALVTLQDQISLKISFSISEKHLPLINKGTKVRFTTALSTAQLEATVLATEPGLDASGRSLEVQARVDNSDKKFRPGMSAKIHFDSNGKDAKGVKVPTEALMPGDGGYNAFVIVDGKAKPVAVTIGTRTEADAVITSGLSTGDSIIVSNMLRITDGTPVEAIIPTK